MPHQRHSFIQKRLVQIPILFADLDCKVRRTYLWLVLPNHEYIHSVTAPCTMYLSFDTFAVYWYPVLMALGIYCLLDGTQSSYSSGHLHSQLYHQDHNHNLLVFSPHGPSPWWWIINIILIIVIKILMTIAILTMMTIPIMFIITAIMVIIIILRLC